MFRHGPEPGPHLVGPVVIDIKKENQSLGKAVGLRPQVPGHRIEPVVIKIIGNRSRDRNKKRHHHGDAHERHQGIDGDNGEAATEGFFTYVGEDGHWDYF